MLVTRPEPDASETAGRLDALGITAVVAPLLKFRTLEVGLPDPAGFSAMAVTSAHALKALEERGVAERYFGLPVFAVGERTAKAARRMGFARVESAGGSFSLLVERLAHAGIAGPVFYPAGRDVTGDLARSLAPTGRMVITAEVYAMDAAERLPEGVAAMLTEGAIGAALFYSRRTAETFVKLAAPVVEVMLRSRIGMLCLSETVAAPLVDAHFVRVGLAEQASEEAMMGLALSFARDENA